MLEKVEEMENDPMAPKNTIEPPIEVDELGPGDAEIELEEYADIILEDDSFDESLPFGGQEFSALNRQLDQLQSALDEIESRNAGIHQELLEILHSNREVRQTIKEEIVNKDDDPSSGKSGENLGNSSGSSSSNNDGVNEPSRCQHTNGQSGRNSENNKRDEITISNADGLMSSTSVIAHMLNVVTQDIEKMST